MLAIDTNMLVRLIANDDSAQAQIAQERTANGAWVSHLVLAECIWVLSAKYRLSKTNLANAIETLLTHPNVAIEDAHVVQAALRNFRQHRNVEFSDCLILAIARKAGHTPMATFDRDFGKVDGAERLARKA